VAFHRAKTALTSVLALGALVCACRATHQPASPATISPPPTTQPAAPIVNIQPLPVRPVQKSQPITPDKCPATNAPTAPTYGLITCDLTKTTLYTLGPEAMRLALTHVDSPKSLTSDFYEVNLTMDPPSATAWASFTATHLHAHIALIRDDLVLEAPMIEGQVTSGQLALTTQTAQAAVQLAQLAGRPA
jgi:preprotein translocase subunit SecD